MTPKLPTFRELKSPTLGESPCTSGCLSHRFGRFGKSTIIRTKRCRRKLRPRAGSRPGKESGACSREGCLRESRLLGNKRVLNRRSDACKSRFQPPGRNVFAATFSLLGRVRRLALAIGVRRLPRVVPFVFLVLLNHAVQRPWTIGLSGKRNGGQDQDRSGDDHGHKLFHDGLPDHAFDAKRCASRGR